jgi:hypothetical protein
LKVAYIEKNAHVFIFESHYNKTRVGTVLKLNTKKLVYYTQKEGKILFLKTCSHMLSRCCTSEECYVDQVQMTLARCAHVLDMLDFFGA